MYRAALRSASRPLVGGLRTTAVRAAPRRFASTASPGEKARTWKGSAVRLGLAFAAVYYYNTSPVFADQAAAETISAPAAFSKDDLPTVDSVIEEKRKQIRAQPEKPAEKAPADPKDAEAQSVAAAGSPAALEEEAGQQGAFNPETGEINWDCPCLGGMADGPCGEEFKTAFSCFVYSTEEPKGMDCIEKFQGMQECFKKYPEIYGAELQDDDDAEGAPEADAAAAATPATELQKVEAETPAVEADSATGVLAELAAEETPAPKPVEKSVDETKDVKEPEPKKVETKVEEKKTEKTD